MAITSGATGSITTAAGDYSELADQNGYAWTGNIAHNLTSFPLFADTDGGMTTIKGHYLFTGTVRTYHDDTLIILAGSLVPDSTLCSLVLASHTGLTYTFTAYMSSVPIDVPAGPGIPTMDFNFTSSGAIVIAKV